MKTNNKIAGKQKVTHSMMIDFLLIEAKQLEKYLKKKVSRNKFIGNL